MEQRLSLITLGVDSLERARAFYEDGLGWSPKFVSDEVIFFQINGMVFGLFPFESLKLDANLPDLKPGVGITLAQNTRTRAEVDTLLSEAEAAGATIVKAAVETEWGGYSGHFTDPDGHLWEVAHNPHWTITPEGMTEA